VAAAELPSFDLVVATVGRTEQLDVLLASLERQTHPRFRVLLVDQNEDDRVDAVLAGHPSLQVEHLRSPRGLSRARNAALPRVTADLVAFPDDDCVYPDDSLERVARRVAADATLEGVTGRAVDVDGSSSPSWSRERVLLNRNNLWNRAISFTVFLRSATVARVGPFDERLGLGARTASESGEEIDYLVRAVDAGARIEYNPSIVVVHPEIALSPAALRARGARDGASIGYILRKHRYPARTVTRMLVRPAAGIVIDPRRARFHAATLRGRLRGYRR
jgi:glycosyltransferase involved in cell wall biosynthesis